MNVIEAIHTRRSIRKFQHKPVPDELVEDLLRAAMMAPSAGNQLDDRVEGFRRLCGLPEKVIPLALAVIGYPAHTLKSEDRFQAGRIHRNTW